MNRVTLSLVACLLAVGMLGVWQLPRGEYWHGSPQEGEVGEERDPVEMQAVRELQGLDICTYCEGIEPGRKHVVSVQISSLDRDEALDNLSKLSSLESVTFYDCDFSLAQAESLAESLKHASELSFHGCSWPMGTFNILADLDSIRDLSISKCELHDSDFPAISGWSNLRVLSIIHSYFDLPFEASLSRNKELETLVLTGTSIGDFKLGQLLAVFPRVRVLQLDDTGLSNQAIDKIVSAASELRELSVKDTDVSSDAALARLAKLKHLYWLSCGNPLLKGEFLEAFSDHPRFQAVSITTPCLDETFFRLVGDNPRIRWLGVRASGVTDSMLKELGQHPTIEYLDISFNPLSEDVVPQLESWPSLKVVGAAATGLAEAAHQKWGGSEVIEEIGQRLQDEH